MTHQTFSFDIYKTIFFGQYWLPKKVNAIIILVHGMGEHSGRYKHVAKKLTENNFGVITFDQFGFAFERSVPGTVFKANFFVITITLNTVTYIKMRPF